jgi:ATP-dependent Clp protease ATP-binding subunit ClpA
MFERFTKEAREIVLASVRLAADGGEAKAGPQHLLLAIAAADGTGARILAEGGVTAAELKAAHERPAQRTILTDDEISALNAVGIDAGAVLRRIEETFGPEALHEPADSRRRGRRGWLGGPFDQPAKKVLELSLREAIALSHRQINSAHILLAVLRHGVSGPLATLLTDHGVSYDDVRQRVIAKPGGAT